MTEPDRTWSVFTKPWRTPTAVELADLVVRLGFNAVEFPLRPGYQVDLDNLPNSLGDLVGVLADRGVSIASVASTTTPEVFEACAKHSVPIIRIMVSIAPEGYVATGDIIRRRLDGLLPLVEEHGVRIGIQPHVNDYIADSSELAHLLKDYDSDKIVAIWDAAHDGLAKKHPANALELLWDDLAMVNFKNASFVPADPPAAGSVPWKVSFVEGPDGLSSWPEAAAYLRERDYTGPICFPAEYSDETDLEAKVARDLSYFRNLLAGEVS